MTIKKKRLQNFIEDLNRIKLKYPEITLDTDHELSSIIVVVRDSKAKNYSEHYSRLEQNNGELSVNIENFLKLL